MQSLVSQLMSKLMMYTWQAFRPIDYTAKTFIEVPFQTQKICSIFSFVKKESALSDDHSIRIKYMFISTSEWCSQRVYLAGYVNLVVFSLNRWWQLMCSVLFLSVNYFIPHLWWAHTGTSCHESSLLDHKAFSGSEIWEMKLAIC